jgi:5'-3' exonuclease
MNLIIDGSSLMHRVHWVSKNNPFITSDGRDVGDVFIFLRTLKSYVRIFDADDIYIAWDKKLIYPSTNFRHTITEQGYKAQRDKEKNASVYDNEVTLSSVLKTLGVKSLFPGVLEADDVVAWLTYNLEGPNLVISADNDLLQLISKSTSFYHPFKKKTITLSNFEKEVGVHKDAFLFYKAIKGDQSDNITGWNGFGEVKAKKTAILISEDNNILKSYTKEQLIILKNNLKLMDLRKGYKIAGELEEKLYKAQLEKSVNIEPDLCEFKEQCKKFEFKQFLDKFDEWENLFRSSRLVAAINQLV